MTDRKKLRVFLGCRNFNWERRNLYESLVDMGHDVFYFDPDQLIKAKDGGKKFDQYEAEFDKADLSDRMITFFKENLPYDIAITYLSPPNTTREAIEEMTSYCPVVNFGANNSMAFSRANVGLCDLFTWNWSTDSFSVPLFEMENASSFYLPMAARPKLYENVEKVIKHFDVSFIGTQSEYRQMLCQILKKKYGVKIFLASGVTDDVLASLIAKSRVALSLKSVQLGAREWVRLRDFEIPMIGSFMLSEYSEDIRDVYTVGQHMDVFGKFDVEQLALQCYYWLKHEKEREIAAERGRLYCRKHHTWEARFNWIFDFVLDNKLVNKKFSMVGEIPQFARPQGGGGEKIHLGCGPVYLKGWTNVDSSQGESTSFFMAKSEGGEKLLPTHSVDSISSYYTIPPDRDKFKSWCKETVVDEDCDVADFHRPSNSVSAICMFHCLEHFPYIEANKLLRRFHDMLHVGGRLFLGLPDIFFMAEVFNKYSDYVPKSEHQLYKNLLYGSQDDGLSFHKSGWREDQIIEDLTEIGFATKKLPNLSGNYSYYIQCTKE